MTALFITARDRACNKTSALFGSVDLSFPFLQCFGHELERCRTCITYVLSGSLSLGRSALGPPGPPGHHTACALRRVPGLVDHPSRSALVS